MSAKLKQLKLSNHYQHAPAHIRSKIFRRHKTKLIQDIHVENTEGKNVHKPKLCGVRNFNSEDNSTKKEMNCADDRSTAGMAFYEVRTSKSKIPSQHVSHWMDANV